MVVYRKRRRYTRCHWQPKSGPLPPLEGYTFEGYRNADGSVAPKPAGITTSVHCVAGVVDYVVKIIERDLLRNAQRRWRGGAESFVRLWRGD
ncbi:hypothetical protein ACLK19_20945 [Escherichia coli]